MKNLFSFKRFWQLVIKQANENRKIFLISIILMLFPAIITYLFNKETDYTPSFTMFMSVFVLTGGLFTSTFFNHRTNTFRNISSLILPVTNLEKIALVIFYTIIIFIPVFIFMYFGSHFVLLIMHNRYMPFMFTDLYEEHSHLFVILVLVILPYIFIQSLFLFLSVAAKKMQFILAFIVFYTLITLSSYFNYHFIRWMTDSENLIMFSLNFSLFPVQINVVSPEYYQIVSPLVNNLNTLIIMLITLLFYYASYLKLKEKEI